MLPADERSVLGNFNHATFSNFGVTTTFLRRGTKFIVRTDGPDGALRDYQIKFTFGTYPLQQYLVPMPGGRLQALGIAWDSRSRKDGGQRWFALYPDRKIDVSNPLHWTAIDQTWNSQCADCHSTNLRKNYDEKSRTYATSWAEIDVACEACHGPGSVHVAWARKNGDWKSLSATKGLTIALDDRNGATWSIDPATGNARRSAQRTSEREITLCARCHSRRSQIHEADVHGQPVGDDYRVALLDSDLYFPDGQIKAEVYEYGSFIQSRMFHAGVTCGDCHEPHGLALRAAGNAVCLQCHAAGKYDSSKHHFHKLGSTGSRCVECHMPARTYMVIDARRDHSIRIPRPDLTATLGTPNACNHCHADKSARWASDAIIKWYGHQPQGFQRYAATFHEADQGAPGAKQALERLAADKEQPAIARATALSRLADYAPAPDSPVIRAATVDPSPLVRRSAAAALSGADPVTSASTLAPVLSDPVRSVQIEAADVLAPLAANDIGSPIGKPLEQAMREYIAAQQLNADRPEAHLNLALLFVKQRKADAAEAQLKQALSLDPTFVPAAVNLADLFREMGRESDGEAVLRAALVRSPNEPALLHALGLVMVREGRNADALSMLGAASKNDPGNARYAYVYAVALGDSGDRALAIETLESSLKLHPYDRDSLAALVTWLQQSNDRVRASTYARRLYELEPGTSSSHRTVPGDAP